MNEAKPNSIPSINYAPEKYQQLLAEKAGRITQLFTPFSPPKPDVYPSPTSHFRMRAEFRIWHDRGEPKTPQLENSAPDNLLQDNALQDNALPQNTSNKNLCHYVMFEPDAPKWAIKVTHYPIGNTSITTLMLPLIAAINQQDILKRKLFQIEFLTTTTQETLVSLIYHRQLDDEWTLLAKQLEQQFSILIIGRARKQRIVLSRDYVIEKLSIKNKTFTYQQQENSFTQPNASINSRMIEWVSDCFANNLASHTRDLLELYCGNGNFTIPLAEYFDKILATEVSKSSIKLAQQNCQLNQVDNIEFIRLSSAETASALKHERQFRRLKHIDIDSYNFSTVLVDPPRAGLDTDTLALVSGFDTIIYISCNPTTLADNLTTLCNTHKIKHFALFDQFPYTDHCECAMVLQRLT